MSNASGPFDVLIVGAGISGIGMAAHLAAKCPNKSFTIIERRAAIGGTWDLFRYPGVRSDSDMYTLGYEFEPWCEDRAIARGDRILAYLKRVAAKRGLEHHMRFGCHVKSANWDSATALWTLTMADSSTLAGRFLYLGAGYYDYDAPHDAAIPGLASFKGTVIHPQFWPQDFDHAGKRVAIIGSGATAVTLVPSMAESAQHVTMLSRTPGWFIPLPARDKLANTLRRVLPGTWAYALVRRFNTAMQAWLYRRSRTAPEEVGAKLTAMLRQGLGPAYDSETFTPPYGPWEQRPCLVPDGDFFKAVRSGKASVVRGEIARVDGTGIALKDGTRLDADVIVTATGLRMVNFGKIAISLDGQLVDFSQRWFYRNCMFSNVPNFAALIGYLNAGWTLKVDLVADWLCRLFSHMDKWGRTVATPILADDAKLIEASPIDAYSSGYLQRARDAMPRSTAEPPWRLTMDYAADREEMRHTPIDDGVLQFGRMGADIPLAPAFP